MLDHKHYISILTGKLGEYRALRELAETVKDSLTPLIETPPIEWDFENDEPQKTIDQHISKTAENIETYWGGDRVLFLDMFHVSNEGAMPDGSHPLTAVFTDARSRDLRVIPVTGLERDAAYQMAVRQAAAQDQRGICLRVTSKEFGEIQNVAGLVSAVLSDLQVSPDFADLVLDFGPLDTQYAATYRMAAMQMINSFPHIHDWRSVTLAGSAFPQKMSGLSPDATHAVARTEWDLWLHIIGQTGAVLRLPAFGDYAIDGPEYADLDWRVIKRTANIRYTHETTWIIVKGHVIQKGSPNQMSGLANILVALPQYCGPGFSWGDQYAYDCANGGGGPGSATTWRQVGTNHHLTYVVNQIANLP